MESVFVRNCVHFLCGMLLLMIPEFVAAAEGYDNEMWWTLFVNWFPMLLLIGIWIYFMKTMKTTRAWDHAEETKRHLEKIEQSLERIAKALEKKIM